ncbi:hypothetical protein HYQ22_gp029 [Acinetobacter phage vB_AbaM_Kimel]|uniref:Uncharacterized protein n=1 Tax=Acinetobacter phage vB_AbaM_Kimel TaxID=2686303 RepID=A0A6B9M1P8_9CAUD|nr:hypothetical protein HYQ22_gp029 [Acinetobacter phage vB_AbaM_Kimel]QHB48184.1 hypothetical protein Kimel_029 [Acinetobacter phage vB_AbaM_Kimel]
MSLTLTKQQVSFLDTTISNSQDLLDAVHAYDTEEHTDLGICLNILDGMTVEEATKAYKEQHED